MNTFKTYMLKKVYPRYQKLDDRPAQIEPLIDWDGFTPIIQGSTTTRSHEGAD